jgi:multidrug efflux pump
MATGAGAESRTAIGWVIIGGVSFATLMTGFVVPSLYLLLAGFTKPVNAIAEALTRMEAEGPKPVVGGHQPVASGHGHAPAE